MKKTLCPQRPRRKSSGLLKSAALFVLSFLLAGCPSRTQSVNSGVEGKLVIKGSNTLGEELAPRLIAEYKKDHPKVTIELESKGSGSGFAALFAGEADIAASSRVVSQEELSKAYASGIELNLHTIGSYSVAVIVNSASTVTNLSRDQLRDIFTGAVKNWKEAGGADAPIHPYMRDKNSGTPLGFQELAMENRPYAPGLSAFTNYLGIANAVAQDPDGIGYTGFDQATHLNVKAITIRGIPPTAVMVNEGQYPVSRVLRLYTDKKKESAVARDFIQFVQSARGQKILDEMGFVPRL